MLECRPRRTKGFPALNTYSNVGGLAARLQAGPRSGRSPHPRHTNGDVGGRIAGRGGVLGGGCLLTQAAGKITLDGIDVRDILKQMGEGIAALVDSAGSERHTVQWSPDGIHFTRAAKVERIHTGCGPLDLDAFTDDGYGAGITWGVAQHRDGRSLHLIRFDCELQAPKRPKGE